MRHSHIYFLFRLLEAPRRLVVVILRVPDGEASPLLDPDISQAEVVIAVGHRGGAGLGGGGLLTHLHRIKDPLPGGNSSERCEM